MGNLISANTGAGVDISGGSSGNIVQGNDIGTQSGGVGALGNHGVGVVITTTGNTVGGTTLAARNIIAGNASNGVSLDGSGNLVEGNFIGVDATGNTALGNQGDGVFVGGSSNTIGGSTTGAGNLISGNAQNGVNISGGAANNLVAGNLIGTDSTGSLALGNSSDGVQITGASNNTVGGTFLAARNVISANGGNGVFVQDGGSTPSTSNVIAGNYIGTDVTGTVGVGTDGKTLGNTQNGVLIFASSDNTVGGTASGSGNVLSNNGSSGVSISGNGTSANNVILGNLIGTDSSGKKALGNKGAGVDFFDTLANTVGGTTTGARNVISGNSNEGIFIGSSGTTATPAAIQVLGNYIGTDISGMQSLGGGLGGITVADSVGTTIGGTTTGAGNLISGNGMGTEPGISVSGTSQETLIEGNLIGTDATGLAPIGGSPSQSNVQGIDIDAQNNTVGGTAPGAGNTIAFNVLRGIIVFVTAPITPSGNVIEGNTIHSNAGDGIVLQSSPGVVFSTLINANVIANNAGNGVSILGPSNNTLTNNTISNNGNDGVEVDSGTGNSILTNTIFDNANLQIELVSGGNNSQPAPVLTTASSGTGGTTTIVGTLQAAPETQYQVQFFSSPASTPPGFAELETFLGQVMNVTTNSSGLANINVTLPVAVAADQYLTTTATNQATGDTSAPAKTSPNLQVTLTAVPEPVNQTQNLTYTITLANIGASPTTAITLTNTLPVSGITFISATGGVTPVGNTLTFPAVDLDRGATTTYTIVVQANTPGTISDTATATYTDETDNPPIDPTTLTDTVPSTINPVANLVLTATAAPTTLIEGQDLTYTDTVLNNGPSPSTGVILTDTLPAGVTFISATGGVTPVGNVLTFNLGTLAVNAQAIVTIVVQPVAAGTLVNNVKVTSTTTDLDTTTNTATVSTSVAEGFIITNTNDSGAGSLRQVLLNVNGSANPASITIGVEIPGPGPYVIQPTSPLPVIAHPLVLNATPATGFSGTAPLVIDGSLIPASPAPANVALTPGLLDVNAPNVVLRGLTISGFAGFGVVLGVQSGNDTLSDDNIGTNVNGTAVVAPNTIGGVLVLSAGNTIGSTTTQDTNAISGNAYGVYLSGTGATANKVIGNLIGTDRSGQNILGTNADKIDGIEIDGNVFGGSQYSSGASARGQPHRRLPGGHLSLRRGGDERHWGQRDPAKRDQHAEQFRPGARRHPPLVRQRQHDRKQRHLEQHRLGHRALQFRGRQRRHGEHIDQELEHRRVHRGRNEQHDRDQRRRQHHLRKWLERRRSRRDDDHRQHGAGQHDPGERAGWRLHLQGRKQHDRWTERRRRQPDREQLLQRRAPGRLERHREPCRGQHDRQPAKRLRRAPRKRRHGEYHRRHRWCSQHLAEQRPGQHPGPVERTPPLGQFLGRQHDRRQQRRTRGAAADDYQAAQASPQGRSPRGPARSPARRPTAPARAPASPQEKGKALSGRDGASLSGHRVRPCGAARAAAEVEVQECHGLDSERPGS